MKRKRLLPVFLVLCIFFSGIFQTSVAEAVKRKPVYLVLGDSIATGYRSKGLHFYEESFTYLVAEKMGLTLVNRAEDGNMIEDVLIQINGGSLDEYIKEAKLISISCGGKDMVYSVCRALAKQMGAGEDEKRVAESYRDKLFYSGSTEERKELLLNASELLKDYDASFFDECVEDYQNMLHLILKAIRKKNKDVTILITTQINPYSHFKTELKEKLSAPMTKCNDRLLQALKQKALEEEYYVVDLHDLFDKNEGLTDAQDVPYLVLDFHPNEEGHRRIAELICTQLHEIDFEKEEESHGAVFGTGENFWLLFGGTIIAVFFSIAAGFADQMIKTGKLFKRRKGDENGRD